MTNNFTREARYVVLKSADVMQCLTVNELIALRHIQAKVAEHRAETGKPPLDCVVVESGWPEYEPTWQAIEARVTGERPAPIEQDTSVRKAWARFSNELHRSPDAPYPGMADAFERHFSQSFTDREWRAESATWAAAWKAAKNHGAQTQSAPSVSDSWPIHADPFAYVIQHLNSNPYPLTKDETITFIKELRTLYNAAPEAKP